MTASQLTLTYDGLILQKPVLENFDAYLEFWETQKTDTENTTHILTIEEIWSRFLKFIGHWSIYGYGSFLVYNEISTQIVGEVGIARYVRGINKDLDTYPEVFWRTCPKERGQSISKRAMTIVLDWATKQTKLNRINAIIGASNIASLRIAEHLNFQQFGSGIYKGTNVDFFKINIQ